MTKGVYPGNLIRVSRRRERSTLPNAIDQSSKLKTVRLIGELLITFKRANTMIMKEFLFQS